MHVKTMSAYMIIHGDQKKFSFQSDTWSGAFGWGTAETTLPGDILERRKEVMVECKAIKAEQDLEFFFFSVCDIGDPKHGQLFCCGDLEVELAEAVFGGKVDDNGILDLGSQVSRKKQFIPPVSKVLAGGWTPSPPSLAHSLSQKSDDYGEVYVDPLAGCCGTVKRRNFKAAVNAVIAANRLASGLLGRGCSHGKVGHDHKTA